MIILIVFAIIFLLILFALLPSYRRHPDFLELDGKFIAHRGLHNIDEGIPENSIASLIEAAARGYIIENDIRLTSDGEVVVFHDANLKRMCGVDKNVSDLTLSELKQHTLLNTNEKIPTLKEFLAVVDLKVPILIEFKALNYDYKLLCEKANAILKEYKGKYFIQSFNPLVLYWYRKHNKDVLRGQLAMQPKKNSVISFITSNYFMNFLAKPDFVAYDHTKSNRLALKVQKLLGAFSIAWTYKSQKEIDETRDIFRAYIFEGFLPK